MGLARTEAEFERAIELNPSYDGAHRLYGYHLVHMCRFEEAVAEMQRAAEALTRVRLPATVLTPLISLPYNLLAV